MSNVAVRSVNGLKFVHGSPVDVIDRPVVLELWSSWCQPCLHAIPHINELSKQYTNVSFVGVNTSEDERIVKKFMDRMGDKMTYNVAVDPDGVMEYYSENLNIRGIPHAIVFNNNKITYSGHPMSPEFESAVAAANQPSLTPKGKRILNFKTLTKDEIKAFSIGDLQDQLAARKVNYSDCFEKSDLLDRVYNTLGFKA